MVKVTPKDGNRTVKEAAKATAKEKMQKRGRAKR